MPHRRGLVWLIPAVLVCWPTIDGARAAEPTRRLALLVGCTKYPELRRSSWLRGPANDVRLMRDLLRDEFEFPKDGPDIRTLTEDGDAHGLPTRKNIQLGFEWLATQAAQAKADGKACQVVILLSGHGSRQPDLSNDPDGDPEPDGFDEVFLPRDAKSMSAEDDKIPNGIPDDDLGQWVKQIRASGALVWLVLDACHSGTGIRGSDDQVARQLELMSDERVRQIEDRVADMRGGGQRFRPRGPLEVADEAGGLVAVYAALPNEPTFEMPLPPNGSEQQWHGLLTFALVQTVKQSKTPMSYAELTQRVRDQYHGWGRSYPIPLVEGANRDDQVLGQESWPNRSELLLTRDQDKLLINAGEMHGVTAGSVLAIHPPPGEAKPEKVHGYVKVTETEYAQSSATPHEFKHDGNVVPANDRLPHGGRARFVYRDYGNWRMRVTLQATGMPPRPLVRQLTRRIKKMTEKEDAVFRWSEKAKDADWILRIDKNDRALLVPAEGWSASSVAGGIQADEQRFGPVPVDEGFESWLETRLRRISRARNLIKLAAESTREGNSPFYDSIDASLEVRRLRDGGDHVGVPWEPDVNGYNFHAGDLVGIKIHNKSNSKLDLTAFFVGSDFGIETIFPKGDDVLNNRLPPGASRMIYRMQVNADTLGLEHVLLIAVKSKGPPIDFAEFEQPGVELARGAVAQHPLKDLLYSAAYNQSQERGVRPIQGKSKSLFDECCLRLLSWTTLPAAE